MIDSWIRTALSWENYLMHDFWLQNGDPRVIGLPFMGSLRIPLAVIIAYLSFVLVIGPRVMARRKPFEMKSTILCYNIALAAANFYFFARATLNYDELFARIFDFNFPEFDRTTDFDRIVIFFNYQYLLSKFVDLCDTIFFVLRKKQSQITVLHVYHHTSVAFLGWTTYRLQSICNVGAVFLYLNSFIHVVMYSYYALASFGPAMQRYLWWKRYITQMQIAQFVILFFHAIAFITLQRGYSLYYTFNYIINTIIYMALFTRFYVQTYKHKNKLSSTTTITTESSTERIKID